MQTVKTQAETQATPVRQSLAWIGQAVSGVVLIVILGLHMFFQHFASAGLLSAAEIVTHVSNPAIFILELLFIVVVTYHALLGLRAVIFDLKLSETARRRVSWGLTAVGLVTVIYGVILAYLIQAQIVAP